MPALLFFIGLFVGGFLGVCTMCLFIASADSSRTEK
ncbi:MAG: DUF3789 domain-containing protein [Clostridia bacterium]|nr:DUF3789 domain-containing protein [Clostridia bacterium]